MRRAAKKDTSHDAIQKALEASGLHVQDFSRMGQGVPDIYAHRAGNHFWFECKTPKAGKHKEPEHNQAKWAERMGLTVFVVKTPEDALSIIGGSTSARGAQQPSKLKIAEFDSPGPLQISPRLPGLSGDPGKLASSP